MFDDSMGSVPVPRDLKSRGTGRVYPGAPFDMIRQAHHKSLRERTQYNFPQKSYRPIHLIQLLAYCSIAEMS